MASRGGLVDRALADVLPPETAQPVPLHAAMRYSVFAGGKRLRPLLVLAACEATGGRVDDALPTACAVELIHTYSLIHDDLPSMDDSLTRRGRPTCHVAFGEALAVLAGDALHALAFQLLTRNARIVGPVRAVRVIEEIAEAIGTQGMVGGQVLDLLGEGRPELARWADWPGDGRRAVYQIHRWKTAALIRACARAGGLLAGAEERALEDLTAYGEHLGLAFQVVDDILDEAGEAARLGKDTGTDAARSKLTFPAAFGVERSRAIAREETARAVAAVAHWGPPARLLVDLALALLEREA
jgi:geranylgeranyl diphosphate synthase type II